jgi:sugar diacid utilization regulator
MTGGSSEVGLSGAARLAEVVSSGRGPTGLARAASEVFDCPVCLLDRSGIVLAVAGATRDQEARLSEGGEGVSTVELGIGDEVVGEARLLSADPDGDLLATLTALAALEVERTRSATWGNEEQAERLVSSLMEESVADLGALVDEAEEIGCELSRGAGFLMLKAHPGSAQESDWRSRVLDLVLRTARNAAPGTIAALEDDPEASVVGVLVPCQDEARLLKVQEVLDRELPRSLGGFGVVISRSRHAVEPEEIPRASSEARLALNVGVAEGRSPIAFEETGAYRLLLGTSQEELRSFYSETVEPLVLYDEQYETDLVTTVEAYLDSDANVPATAKKLFTHRHTIRYRLERIRDLSGHDATATEGRERLGLGIKAMRVLGIAPPRSRSRETGKQQ